MITITEVARVYNETNERVFVEIQKTNLSLSQLESVSENSTTMKNVTVNGMNALDAEYEYSDKQNVHQVIIDASSARYIFKFWAPNEEFDGQKSSFDMILNSFQVK